MKDQTTYLNKPLDTSILEILNQLEPKKVFLVAGKSSYSASGAKAICETIFSQYEVMKFSDFSPNPTLEEIEKGVLEFRVFQPDIVIAIGGGSAIDIAKAVNILAVQNTSDFLGYVEGVIPLTKGGSPLVAVPTTAGTGSEATHFAVVYVGTKKYSLAHEEMLPKFAVIDPALTYSMSAYQTAVTGLDALSQAMEAMWSVRATEESLAYSRKALPMIIAWLPKAVHEPTPESRQIMAEGAYLAGKAINIAKTTASHAMSYSLTMHFGIAHGHAVSLTLPSLLRFNAGVSPDNSSHPNGADQTQKIISEIVEFLNGSDVDQAVSKLELFISSLGMETRLSKLGISENDIELLVSEMSLERAGNNPRNFTKSDAVSILKNIL